MIIWLPELMHTSAANGILKILEEPPPQTFFLLVTQTAEQLLPTILSRTQSVHIPQLQDADIDEFLKTKHAVEEDKRHNIVQLAEGDLNFALKLIDSEEDHHQTRFFDWMRACYNFQKDAAKLIALSDEFHELDKLTQRNLLMYGLSMMREALLYIAEADKISRIKGAEETFIKNFSKHLNISKTETISRLMNDAQYHLERNGSAKMIFMNLSLQIGKTINP